MAFRFWRRVGLAPGITMNLSKSGGSLSFGPRGAKFTVSPRGNRATAGLPGTGLFYTQRLAGGQSSGAGARNEGAPEAPVVDVNDRLTLGFFKRLATPADEEALVDGCRAMITGNEEEALEHLKNALHLADAAYLAGFLALKRERLHEAGQCLTAAAQKHEELGRYFAKYQLDAITSIPLTDEVVAHVGPDLRGVLLGLVEVYQGLERWKDAVATLERLLRIEPDDVVVKLSVAEVLLDAKPDDPDMCQRVVHFAEGVDNETPIHAALLLYKARALRGLGLLDAARNTLTTALRRKKDRPGDLLRALRYERALVYEALGNGRRARKDLERLYAQAPGYEDVAHRLGL